MPTGRRWLRWGVALAGAVAVLGSLLGAAAAGAVGVAGGTPAPVPAAAPQLGHTGTPTGGGAGSIRLAQVPIPQFTVATSGDRWTHGALPSGTGPLQEYGVTLSDDPALGGVLAFGGETTATGKFTDTTSLLADGVWTDLCGVSSTCGHLPPARAYGQATYDPTLGGVVLFGGYGRAYPADVLTDTWLFVDGQWKNLTTQESPPAEATFTGLSDFVYDAHDGYDLLLDGNQSWSFSDGNWTREGSVGSFVAAGPMVYVPLDHRVILVWEWPNFQTWSYSAGSWGRLSTHGAPPVGTPLGGFADPLTGALLLYGPSGTSANSTWRFDGTNWTNQTAAVRGAPGGWGLSAIAAMTETTDGVGELFVVNYSVTSGSDVQLWRFSDPLTVSASLSLGAVDVNEPFQLDLSGVGGGRPYSVLLSTDAGACESVANFTGVASVGCATGLIGTTTVNLTVEDAVGDSLGGSLPIMGNPDPEAFAQAAPLATTVGVPVHFSGFALYGTPPYSPVWKFGDGTTTTNGSVDHAFRFAGTYTATFLVADAGGGTVVAPTTILVNPGLTVSASESELVTDVGLPVQFGATVTGGTYPDWTTWQFGDGTSFPAGTASHAFATPGTFAPTVQVHDFVGASTSGALQLRVNPALLVSATAVADGGTTVQFNATPSGGTGPFSYWWQFGDGTAMPGELSAHAYVLSGSYPASVTVNDSAGASVFVRVWVNISTASVGPVPPPPTGTIGTGNSTGTGSPPVTGPVSVQHDGDSLAASLPLGDAIVLAGVAAVVGFALSSAYHRFRPPRNGPYGRRAPRGRTGPALRSRPRSPTRRPAPRRAATVRAR